MSSAEQLISIGRIVGTHGIKGQLKVGTFSGNADTLSSVDTVLLGVAGGDPVPFRVGRVVAHGKKVAVSFQGYDDINEVLPLVGREIFVRREQLPEPEPGEYFWCDLLGLEVRTDTGDRLGEIVSIMETGSNDIYVVREGTTEILVPALEDVVIDVDLEKRLMRVVLPEGLLDL